MVGFWIIFAFLILCWGSGTFLLFVDEADAAKETGSSSKGSSTIIWFSDIQEQKSNTQCVLVQTLIV